MLVGVSSLIIKRCAPPQPQSPSPDIFLWLLSGNKRVAYKRIDTR